MSGHCCESQQTESASPVFKRALWFALIINFSMFLVEIIASEYSDSMSLKADALDFFADSANYLISLVVVAASVATRAKASLFKAGTMLLLGSYVMIAAILRIIYGSEPHAETMGIIGALALIANVVVAVILYRFRDGDSNMQSVWLCTRNDAIGNLMVLSAAVAVVVSGTRWPDLAVAIVIAFLAITSAIKVIRLAKAELKSGEVVVGS